MGSRVQGGHPRARGGCGRGGAASSRKDVLGAPSMGWKRNGVLTVAWMWLLGRPRRKIWGAGPGSRLRGSLHSRWSGFLCDLGCHQVFVIWGCGGGPAGWPAGMCGGGSGCRSSVGCFHWQVKLGIWRGLPARPLALGLQGPLHLQLPTPEVPGLDPCTSPDHWGQIDPVYLACVCCDQECLVPVVSVLFLEHRLAAPASARWDLPG